MNYPGWVVDGPWKFSRSAKWDEAIIQCNKSWQKWDRKFQVSWFHFYNCIILFLCILFKWGSGLYPFQVSWFHLDADSCFVHSFQANETLLLHISLSLSPPIYLCVNIPVSSCWEASPRTCMGGKNFSTMWDPPIIINPTPTLSNPHELTLTLIWC